ncbi:ATP-binding protein [bacterium]|nr:ATP-binding protein [bacterium]
MINKSRPDATFFLVKLQLPLHTIFTRTATSSAVQIAELLSFNDKDKYYLESAVDEAFCNAVEHFSGIVKNDEYIYVEFTIEEDSLVVSIRDKGIPFDLRQADRYTPDNIEGMDFPGLGMLLMHQGMDSVELFVHGREGKETRLTKKIKYKNIPQELLDTRIRKRGVKRPTIRDAIIRVPRLDELGEITRLAWRCYGFTQEDLLYDVDLLTKKVKNGEFKPVVAFDPKSSDMIGHGGLKYHDLKVKVGEFSLGFVDPSYRCPGLVEKVMKELLEIAKNNGDAGMFDCSVTTHTFSQKAQQVHIGSKPCGLMLGIAASGMQVKELKTSKQDKGSIVNHYIPFDFSQETIYVTDHHREMAEKIYSWMELPRTFGVADMEPPAGDSNISMFTLPDELNVTFIIVHTIGTDTVDEITNGFQQCRRDGRDAVYLFLPCGVSSSPYLVEKCENLGFSFAGIMPHIHDGDDRFLMQNVSIPLDLEKIRVYGDMGRELFDYIKMEIKRIEDK